MATQNTAALEHFFFNVWNVGCGSIRKSELLFLCGRARYTSSIWDKVQELWEEVCDKKYPLLIGDSDTEATWAFAYGEGLKPDKNSWFKDVKTYMTV